MLSTKGRKPLILFPLPFRQVDQAVGKSGLIMKSGEVSERNEKLEAVDELGDLAETGKGGGLSDRLEAAFENSTAAAEGRAKVRAGDDRSGCMVPWIVIHKGFFLAV